jgi:hypothetical protein
MPKFNNAKDLERHLKKAMDALQFEVIKATQAQLGSKTVSPRDKGRLRSSWFASEGTASSAVPPEGADSPNTDATGLRVDSSKTYHLTSSLPYAQSVAIEGNVVSQPKTWFTSFRNETIPRIQQTAAKVIKQQFSL